MAKLIKVDRNGTKYWEELVSCDRCGGAGGWDGWSATGWKCYKCGGNGKMLDVRKEYTPEYEAKLAERRRKAAEKREAERKAYELEHAAEIAAKEAERQRMEAEREAEARRVAELKANSDHVGTVGEKIAAEAVYEFSAHYEVKSFSGFGTETRYIHKFRTDDGNVLVWKTGRGIGDKVNGNGVRVRITGTVKEHSEYDGEKQTALLRCKVEQITE